VCAYLQSYCLEEMNSRASVQTLVSTLVIATDFLICNCKVEDEPNTHDSHFAMIHLCSELLHLQLFVCVRVKPHAHREATTKHILHTHAYTHTRAHTHMRTHLLLQLLHSKLHDGSLGLHFGYAHKRKRT